jgi:ribonuclease E
MDASLVFDQTEALLVIDVNSQKAQARDPEALRVKTNLLAAAEIARQLRLRNTAGIVVVISSACIRQKTGPSWNRTFTAEFKKNRGKITIGGLTRLGLFELVRQLP